MGIVYPNGSVEVTIPATESIAVFTTGEAKVYRKLSFPNYPNERTALGSVTATQTVFGAYATGATIIVEAGADQVEYTVGVGPSCPGILKTKIQATPGTLNATGALTADLIITGIVTSTSAAAVTATVPTGTVLDAAVDFAINDSFDWNVINTGPSAFTVTAAADHTLVGVAAVATVTSARFRTRKTAANTFVTYRIS